MMEIHAIQQYRLAVFESECLNFLNSTHYALLQADSSEILDVFAELVGVFSRASNSASHSNFSSVRTSAHDLGDLAHRDFIVQFILLADDIFLFDAGASAGYYPPGSSEALLASLEDEFPRFGEPLEFIGECLFGDDYSNLRLKRQSLIDTATFSGAHLAWHEVKTAKFRRCIDMLFLASEMSYLDAMSMLSHLHALIATGSGVVLESEEVDAITWALSGATPLFGQHDPEATTIEWSTIYTAVQNALSDPHSRASGLRKVRHDLASAAASIWIDGPVRFATIAPHGESEQIFFPDEAREARNRSAD